MCARICTRTGACCEELGMIAKRPARLRMRLRTPVNAHLASRRARLSTHMNAKRHQSRTRTRKQPRYIATLHNNHATSLHRPVVISHHRTAALWRACHDTMSRADTDEPLCAHRTHMHTRMHIHVRSCIRLHVHILSIYVYIYMRIMAFIYRTVAYACTSACA